MIEEHFRTKIWTQLQHPYKHSLTDFAYSNPALPGVSSLESTLNWLVAVLYPNTQPSVATPADLPTGLNTPNPGDVTPSILDYRVVTDDGDGKAAGYRYEQREGDVAPIWYKIYDMDWGEDSILSNFLASTQDVYMYKHGISDKDENGDVLTGALAGQHLYGGDLANQHLTLHANAGDAPGLHSGYIQLDDDTRPTIDNAFDIGTLTQKFKTGYFSTSLLVGNVTISGAQISSDTGAISFADENLTTTGTLTSGVHTVNGQLVLQQIATPSNPAAGYDSLYFKADDKLYRLTSAGQEKLVGLEFTSTNDNRLLRSDGLTGDAIQESGIIVDDSDAITGVTSLSVGNLTMALNAIASTDLNGDISLTPNGTGKVVVPNLRNTGLTNDVLMVPRTDGTLTSTGVAVDVSNNITGVLSLTSGNILLSGNEISSVNVNGNISLSPNGTGNVVLTTTIRGSLDNSRDLGVASHRFANLFLANSINVGTNAITAGTLMSLRDVTVGANVGDSLFWDGTKFVASNPDTEIDHGELSGLADDDHTQYLLLAGRSGGQEVVGGTDASDDLVFSSTSNATKGNILTRDNFLPFTDASYSSGWNGTDLGNGTHYFRDLYTKGELKGARVENYLSGGLPSSSANNVGRIIYTTDTKKLYVDDGTAFRVAGVGKYINDEVFNGVELTKTIDVSSQIQDARTAIIQLLDNANNFERIYCKLEAISATQVRITTNIALPAGSYRLIVME